MGMLEAITSVNPNLDNIVDSKELSQARTKHMVDTGAFEKELSNDEIWERFRHAYNKAAGFDLGENGDE